jgi:hypothetical protein
MNAWSNILISSQNPEIIKINKLEARLGKLPANVYSIRELITRHEVCHFKYQQHIKKIKNSIITLEPKVAPDKIGINHIQHGENAWKNDASGKSLLGQQYVWAIKDWLNEIRSKEMPDKYDTMLGQKVQKWVGGKNADKIRLIQLLLARLTWDWKLYEELQHGGEYKELELQICRMDICHYAFPSNLNRLLQGIGEMKPIENYEGCGSFDNSIQKFVDKELLALYDLFKSLCNNKKSDEKSQIKAWLVACLIKTLKEQVELSEPLIDL